MKKLLLINGPNLNLLGTREPDKYGTTTLAKIETDLRAFVESTGGTLAAYQSNHEGDLVDRIQQAAKEGIEAVIINPGAYTHTSIAIRDAFLSVKIPFIEVHLSNIFKREEFRHHSYLSDIAEGCIIGLGVHGYFSAAWIVYHSARKPEPPRSIRCQRQQRRNGRRDDERAHKLFI